MYKNTKNAELELKILVFFFIVRQAIALRNKINKIKINSSQSTKTSLPTF